MFIDRTEIEVVGFAGGGGSCEGLKAALGHSPHVAINHDEVAVAVHTANHPDTLHYCNNIFKAVPIDVLEDVRKKLKLKRLPKIGLAWFSPDCTHFSRARGGKPRRKDTRDLPWVILGWAKLAPELRPRIIVIENVVEFLDYGPLDADGQQIASKKGESFKRLIAAFKRYGYKAEWRRIKAYRKGVPTTRERLYIVLRNDGLPIVWAEDKFAEPKSPYVIAGKRAPWRAAAECIDWSLPCPSIFDTKKQIWDRYGIRAIRPLAHNTQARIARGVWRYVIDNQDPFIVPINGVPHEVSDVGIDRGEYRGSVGPFVVPVTHTGDSRANDTREPLRTTTAAHRGEHALVMPFLAKHYGGHEGPGIDVRGPLSTCTGVDHHAVVSAGLLSLKGTDRRGSSIAAPVPGICAQGGHVAEVRAFLMKFHRDGGQHQKLTDPLHTIPTVDSFGLVVVMIGGEPYVIVDIGMRMLTPRELFTANGMRRDYIIDRGLWPDGTWRPITKTQQVRLCGNMVCPPVAEDIIRANYVPAMVNDYGVPEFALTAAE
jgi:DNA (cytosine-5)-methyltransferase 1